MAMTPEARVKEKVKRVLNDAKAYHFWPVQMGMGSSTLDCIGCMNGIYFAIETKAPGKKLTPRQEFDKKEMEKAGAAVFVIDGTANTATYTDLQEWLRWAKGQKF